MLLESLGKIERLGSIQFLRQDGYEYPVAEMDEDRANTILRGESMKAKKGMKPVMRMAVPYSEPTAAKEIQKEVIPKEVFPKRRGRKPVRKG